MAPAYGEAVYRIVSRWTETTRLEFVPNAKRPGTKSFDRYSAYSQARYVGEALRLGAKPEDLVHDYSKKFCRMHPGQRVKVPENIMGEEEKAQWAKFLRRMRGPKGLNIAKFNARTQKAVQKLKTMGIDFKDLHDEKNGQETNDLQARRFAADLTAQEILEDVERTGRKVVEKDIRQVLELWAFRQSSTRQNVLPEGQTWVNSDTLGLIKNRMGGFLVTKPTNDYPHFMSLLTRYLNDRKPPEMDCSFPFTTISLNYGYAARRHRDNGNVGPSMIKAFGKFKGGCLAYWPDDDKTVALENLREEDKVCLDISEGLALFDGNRAHEVESFTGERYSLVFFSVANYMKAPEEQLAALRERGYNVPTEESMAMARSLLPPPRGYTGSHSLTSMFGTTTQMEKPKVYQWTETQEERDATPATSSRSSARPQQKAMQQEPPKSANLKTLFFGSSSGGDSSEEASTRAPTDSQPEDSNTPTATPPRKQNAPGLKRRFALASEKKRAKMRNVAKAESDSKKGEVMEPAAGEMASTQLAPELLAAACSRLSILVKGLRSAEIAPEMGIVGLTNVFQAMLYAKEPLQHLVHALELLLQPAAAPLTRKAMSSAIAQAFGVSAPPVESDLAEAARSAAATCEAPPPLELSAAVDAWRAAKEVPACAAKLLRASPGAAEAGTLTRLLLGQSPLQRPEVLRALAHAVALIRPVAPVQRRQFSSTAAQTARLVATAKAVALAFGETGGKTEQLIRVLLADCLPSQLYARCGLRLATAYLPMQTQETQDVELVLSELTGSSLLVEQMYAGEWVQAHKTEDGQVFLFGQSGEELSRGICQALASELAAGLVARECIVEGVLQRDVSSIQIIDCLWLDGRPLVRHSLRERRSALESAVRSGNLVQLPPSEMFTLDEPPTAEVLTGFLQEAESCGCRGVTLKRLEREYEAGAVGSDACISLLLPSA